MLFAVAPDQEGSSQQQQQPTDDAAPQTVSQSRPVLRQRTPSRIDEAIIRLRGGIVWMSCPAAISFVCG